MSERIDEVNKVLHQMVFVYNAVLKGWTVRMRSDGRFKFTKPLRDTTDDYESISVNLEDEYLTDFIKEHLNIDDLIRR